MNKKKRRLSRSSRINPSSFDVTTYPVISSIERVDSQQIADSMDEVSPNNINNINVPSIDEVDVDEAAKVSSINETNAAKSANATADSVIEANEVTGPINPKTIDTIVTNTNIITNTNNLNNLNANANISNATKKVMTANKVINYSMDPMNHFSVFWKSLSCWVSLPKIHAAHIHLPWPRIDKQIIVDNSGFFESGRVTALMGPSGAGKSTLLHSIAGQRREVSGSVNVAGADRPLVMAIVPQFDNLIHNLTVSETIKFACRILCGNQPKEESAMQLIKDFGLIDVLHTYVWKCSGGQRKRLSIAVETLAKPNIIILDEPTTGLDTPSSLSVINLLQRLARSDYPVAVLLTIHQPSYKIFNLFDYLYILSIDGRFVYAGTPERLIPALTRCGFELNTHQSLAEYILEIASGELGKEAIEKLVMDHSQSIARGTTSMRKLKHHRLFDKLERKNHPLFYHFLILFHRALLIDHRSYAALMLRIGFSIFGAIMIGALYTKNGGIGKLSCCIPSFDMFKTQPLDYLATKFERDFHSAIELLSLLYLGVHVNMMVSMSANLLKFPDEMQTVVKEIGNDWYSPAGYWLAKFIADIPMQILTTFMFDSIIYYLAGMPRVLFRYLLILTINFLTNVCSMALSLVIGCYFYKNPRAALYLGGGLLQAPLILLAGYIIRIFRMPVYLQPFAHADYIRYSFLGQVVTLFGFDRCHFENERYLEYLEANNNTNPPDPYWFPALQVMFDQMDTMLKAKNMTKYKYDYSDADKDEYLPYLKRIIHEIGGPVVIEGREFEIGESLAMYFYDLMDWNIFESLGGLVFFVVFFQLLFYFILKSKLRGFIYH